ncbi:hypothetical protein FB567DRAFT_215238 [Paraphoma chrysanthemicola]|uniref:Uncharacterized protein n=1 Tax=Paraphoma chrysanthemicola TaxID=798071 RepID=A0A8K0QVI8_9PLEO|nr:hypothetical protein FB567DRAFT_215238 [Paraphoma chrysanthemicola]
MGSTRGSSFLLRVRIPICCIALLVTAIISAVTSTGATAAALASQPCKVSPSSGRAAVVNGLPGISACLRKRAQKERKHQRKATVRRFSGARPDKTPPRRSATTQRAHRQRSAPRRQQQTAHTMLSRDASWPARGFDIASPPSRALDAMSSMNSLYVRRIGTCQCLAGRRLTEAHVRSGDIAPDACGPVETLPPPTRVMRSFASLASCRSPRLVEKILAAS